MQNDSVEERLRGVFGKVFNCPKPQETASPDNLPQWDSLGHLLLTSAIEEEFAINLTTGDIYQMVNFRTARSVVEERLNAKT